MSPAAFTCRHCLLLNSSTRHTNQSKVHGDLSCLGGEMRTKLLRQKSPNPSTSTPTTVFRCELRSVQVCGHSWNCSLHVTQCLLICVDLKRNDFSACRPYIQGARCVLVDLVSACWCVIVSLRSPHPLSGSFYSSKHRLNTFPVAFGCVSIFSLRRLNSTWQRCKNLQIWTYLRTDFLFFFLRQTLVTWAGAAAVVHVNVNVCWSQGTMNLYIFDNNVRHYIFVFSCLQLCSDFVCHLPDGHLRPVVYIRADRRHSTWIWTQLLELLITAL